MIKIERSIMKCKDKKNKNGLIKKKKKINKKKNKDKN